MSTCSTATSALRRSHDSRRRRRAPSDTCDAADADVDAIHARLERRLVDLERDWDAYKSGRSSPPPGRRHRPSRSATGTPSSAVTVAAVSDDGLLLHLYRCSSPRRLVSSLQRTSSDGAAEIVVAAGSPTRSYEEEGLSSVCSVEEAGNSAAAPSSSCSCCTCRCTVCCGGYSASSSRSGAIAPSSSSGSAAGSGAPQPQGVSVRKSDEGRSMAGTGRAAWIFAIALVVMGFVVAMAVLELGEDDGCAEYLVPT